MPPPAHLLERGDHPSGHETNSASLRLSFRVAGSSDGPSGASQPLLVRQAADSAVQSEIAQVPQAIVPPRAARGTRRNELRRRHPRLPCRPSRRYHCSRRRVRPAPSTQAATTVWPSLRAPPPPRGARREPRSRQPARRAAAPRGRGRQPRAAAPPRPPLETACAHEGADPRAMRGAPGRAARRSVRRAAPAQQPGAPRAAVFPRARRADRRVPRVRARATGAAGASAPTRWFAQDEFPAPRGAAAPTGPDTRARPAPAQGAPARDVQWNPRSAA